MQTKTVAATVKSFFEQFAPLSLKRGEILLSAKDKPSGVYYLDSGHVKQYTLTPDGDELVVNIYKPGSFFPMMGAVADLPNNYFFESMDDIEVYRAPVEETLAFVQEHPAVMYDLLQRLYIGIDGMLLQMTQNVVGDARTKVITALYILAQRFGEKQDSGVTISQYLTHKELGLICGISRETVTRTLNAVEAEGLISIENRHIHLVDVEAIEARITL